MKCSRSFLPLASALPLVAIVLSFAVCLTRGDEPAAAGLKALVVTVDDEQIGAPIVGLIDGKLALGGPTPRSLPLADVLRIEFGKTAASGPASDLTWIGQDNHDLVQVGGAAGGNSIQDLHLHVVNLKAQVLKQVAVTCRFPSKRLHIWRLDTSKTPHWRLAIARADMASDAELYLEPAAEDSFDQQFDVTFTYNDGTTSTASAKATTHTSDKSKVDSGAKPGAGSATAQPAAAAPSKAIVYAGPVNSTAGHLQGDIKSMSAEALVLHTDWQADVQIPLLRVQGVWFGKTAVRADFDRQLAAPAAEDVVFLLAPDKSVAQVSGSVQSLADGKLTMNFQGADRSVKEERLLGVVFSAHPKLAPVSTLYQVVTLTSGDSLSGRLTAFDEREVELETPWETRVKLPTAALANIRTRNGKLTFLGDLEPVAVEEVAYFGRVIPWQRDQGFDGSPPRVKGKQPVRSLAMHSRSVLSFALDEQYEKFRATVGFDDSAAERGRVVCRVLVDGREAFALPDFRGDQSPREVDVSVKGCKVLALEVDFGEGEDVGDRIIWAEPRLFRAEQK